MQFDFENAFCNIVISPISLPMFYVVKVKGWDRHTRENVAAVPFLSRIFASQKLVEIWSGFNSCRLIAKIVVRRFDLGCYVAAIKVDFGAAAITKYAQHL